MIREIQIEGLRLRLRTIRRGRHWYFTYVDVFHDGRWLDCGDPHRGETSSAKARTSILHYARITIRKHESAAASM